MIFVKKLKNTMYCVDWFSKIKLKKVVRNKQNLQNLIEEDTCWKFRRNEVSVGNEGLGERLDFDLEGGGWDLTPGEESKFDDDRRKLVKFLI